ncbi:hypothetical protein SKAU_G00092150 [Synaphobranchus kaupii]|uniref:Uncharacterized protein n=1 Tax=Synaphobranchus kaupii TaxID=118154 RepID=A0A9Q1FXD8_SYNKA|nr:hypothetical protein SKAU_G00092150 [Synaphobranchus kaupii]
MVSGDALRTGKDGGGNGGQCFQQPHLTCGSGMITALFKKRRPHSASLFERCAGVETHPPGTSPHEPRNLTGVHELAILLHRQAHNGLTARRSVSRRLPPRPQWRRAVRCGAKGGAPVRRKDGV